MKHNTVTHEFVDKIPNSIEEGRVYVSIPYATAVHKCFCGCDNEVVTPLNPTDWELTFNGKTISLDPSIGNWNFPCQSHYWIKQNKVRWVRRWSKEEINAGRTQECLEKEAYFNVDILTADDQIRRSLWFKLMNKLGLK